MHTNNAIKSNELNIRLVVCFLLAFMCIFAITLKRERKKNTDINFPNCVASYFKSIPRLLSKCNVNLPPFDCIKKWIGIFIKQFLLINIIKLDEILRSFFVIISIFCLSYFLLNFSTLFDQKKIANAYFMTTFQFNQRVVQANCLQRADDG